MKMLSHKAPKGKLENNGFRAVTGCYRVLPFENWSSGLTLVKVISNIISKLVPFKVCYIPSVTTKSSNHLFLPSCKENFFYLFFTNTYRLALNVKSGFVDSLCLKVIQGYFFTSIIHMLGASEVFFCYRFAVLKTVTTGNNR